MDTKDPRFVSAYNELVNAFFRFINVVNPAPSRSDQIRLICDSMTSLVNMLQAAPAEVENDGTLREPLNGALNVNEQYNSEDVAKQTDNNLAETDSDPAANVATSIYGEKRYAKEPTFTGEGINKFLNKQLKKENPNDADGDIDPDDYIFIMEFDPETEKGIFYLNDDVNLQPVFNDSMESGVVVLKDNPNPLDYKTASTGKIEKSTGGWEIVEPLVLSKKD